MNVGDTIKLSELCKLDNHDIIFEPANMPGHLLRLANKHWDPMRVNCFAIVQNGQDWRDLGVVEKKISSLVRVVAIKQKKEG